MNGLDEEKIKIIKNVAEILKLAEDELNDDNLEDTEITTILDLEDLKSLKALYDLCVEEINENIKLKERLRKYEGKV